MKYLIVVDMQNDFITGALGSPEAEAILPYVRDKVAGFEGRVLFTRDTHLENYPHTQEGRKLPVAHCIKGSDGWQIHPELEALRRTEPIDKVTFGASELVERLRADEEHESVEFVGLCTDICVISNVMLTKAFFPEVPLTVDAKGCAGVTSASHATALEAMRAVQVDIINA